MPIKYLYRLVDERAGTRSAELPLLSVSQYLGVVPRSSITDKEPRSDDLGAYKVCDANDVIINRMSAFEGAIGISDRPGLVSPEYLVLRSGAETDPRFLNYLLGSRWFVGQMTERVRGIGSPDQSSVRTPRINPEDLGRIKVAIPSTEEQRRIADFLDREVAQIGAVVTARRRMIEVLKERWAGFVDSQINGKAENEYSLGKVLKKILDRRGVTPTKLGSEFQEAGIPVVSARNVRRGEIDLSEEVRYVSEATAQRWMRDPLEDGDVILTSEAPMGEVARIRPEQLPLCIGQRLFALRPNRSMLDSTYLFFVLQTTRIRQQFDYLSTGSTATGIRQRYLQRLRLPVPSKLDQERIAEGMVTAQRQFHAASSAISEQITVLVERRQGLISAAVTGGLAT